MDDGYMVECIRRRLSSMRGKAREQFRFGAKQPQQIASYRHMLYRSIADSEFAMVVTTMEWMRKRAVCEKDQRVRAWWQLIAVCVLRLSVSFAFRILFPAEKK